MNKCKYCKHQRKDKVWRYCVSPKIQVDPERPTDKMSINAVRANFMKGDKFRNCPYWKEKGME